MKKTKTLDVSAWQDSRVGESLRAQGRRDEGRGGEESGIDRDRSFAGDAGDVDLRLQSSARERVERLSPSPQPPPPSPTLANRPRGARRFDTRRAASRHVDVYADLCKLTCINGTEVTCARSLDLEAGSFPDAGSSSATAGIAITSCDSSLRPSSFIVALGSGMILSRRGPSS